MGRLHPNTPKTPPGWISLVQPTFPGNSPQSYLRSILPSPCATEQQTCKKLEPSQTNPQCCFSYPTTPHTLIGTEVNERGLGKLLICTPLVYCLINLGKNQTNNETTLAAPELQTKSAEGASISLQR